MSELKLSVTTYLFYQLAARLGLHQHWTDPDKLSLSVGKLILREEM